MEFLATEVLNEYISEDRLPKLELMGLQTGILHFLWDELNDSL